jgi:molybdenum-dependent DNA-binding transcriptional regulator ModE
VFKMSIKPQWLVEGPDAVRRPLHQLIELLTAMDEAGQLAAAAKKLDVSYRYAWELVRRPASTSPTRARRSQSKRRFRTRLRLKGRRANPGR